MSAAREWALRTAGSEPLQDDFASGSQGPDDRAAPARSGIVIGRYQRTVVVTVHGELDHPRAAQLNYVLADLIDGQGNLSLLVDLHDATTADAERVSVFAEAAERLRRRGGAMTLSKPPVLLHEALRDGGLGHLVGTFLHQHGAECGPASERSARGERRAHPAGRSPSNPSEGSHR
jgi:anti-anti-sigma factor